MSIRLQLILFGVVGNLLVALIFVFSFNYRENIQENSSSESLLTLYEAAWFQTYNSSFNSMFKWQPVIGSNASFWDPDGEVFQDEVLPNGNFTNPFLDTVSAGRIGDAQYILDLFFEEDLSSSDAICIPRDFSAVELRGTCRALLPLPCVTLIIPFRQPEIYHTTHR